MSKLDEINAAFKAMTPGPYRYDHQGWFESLNRTINHTGSETEMYVLGARNEPADGEGLEEVLNGMSQLLRIAHAARAWAITHTRPRGDMQAFRDEQELLNAIDEVT